MLEGVIPLPTNGTTDISVKLYGSTKVNARDQKLFDSCAMRALRRSAAVKLILEGISPDALDTVACAVGIRKPLATPVTWHPDDLAWIRDRLWDKALRFLDERGKSQGVWS